MMKRIEMDFCGNKNAYNSSRNHENLNLKTGGVAECGPDLPELGPSKVGPSQVGGRRSEGRKVGGRAP